MLHYILAQVRIQLIFKNPPSHSLLLLDSDLPVLFRLWLLSPQYPLFLAVDSSWAPQSLWSYIQYRKGDLSFSECSPLTTDWPSFSPLCIRSYASDFICAHPSYTSCSPQLQHPCIPAVDISCGCSLQLFVWSWIWPTFCHSVCLQQRWTPALARALPFSTRTLRAMLKMRLANL